MSVTKLRNLSTRNMLLFIFISILIVSSVPINREKQINLALPYQNSNNREQFAGLNDVVEFEAFLDDYIPNQLSDYSISGMTISVVKDNNLFFKKGYGFSDRARDEYVDPENTLFRVGSISKTFTAIAVMQLVEDGLLDLDEDVNNYLVEFQLPETYEDAITLSHLLTHTAGFEEMNYPVISFEFEQTELNEVLEEGMPERVHFPGDVVSYSNYGLSLAGYIVEIVSEKPFEDYITDEILTPLGMTKSSFEQPLPTYLRYNMSKGYDDHYGILPFEYLPIAPAGALSSTATDMSNLMITLLNNGSYNGAQILQNETMHLMQSQHFTGHSQLPGVCYGLYESDMNGYYILGHGGDTIAFHSLMALMPEENIGFFISYNSYNGMYAKGDFHSAFMERYFPGPDTYSVTPISDYKKRAEYFEGVYITTRRFYTNVNPRLWIDLASVTITSNDGFIQFEGLDIDFVEVESNLFQDASGTTDYKLFFKTDDKGRIVSFYSNLFGSVTELELIHPIHSNIEMQIIVISIISGVLLLSVISWGVVAIVRKKKGKMVRNHLASAAKWSVLANVSIIAITIGLMYTITNSRIILSTETFTVFGAFFILPILSLLIIGLNLIFMGISWTDKPFFKRRLNWKLWEKVHYTVTTITSLGYIWLFTYWQFLGF